MPPSRYCVWYQSGMESARPECNRKVKRRTGGFLRFVADVPERHRHGGDAPRILVRIRPILRSLAKGGVRFPAAPTPFVVTVLVAANYRSMPVGEKPAVEKTPSPGHSGRGVPIASVRIQPILRSLTKGPVRSLAALKVPAQTSERTSPHEGSIPDRCAAEPRQCALLNQRTPT